MTEEEAQAAALEGVSRETAHRFDVYIGALAKWQRTINLVSPSTLGIAWQRHILDSRQVFDVRLRDRGRWLDLGSGGGFPGLAVAIYAAEIAPELAVTLVESDIRKCAFLRDVARQTNVPVNICSRRIENLPPQSADIISARAVTALDRLLDLAARHLAPGGTCLFPKGASHLEELATAREGWHMDVETLPSLTSADAVILRIRNPRHA